MITANNLTKRFQDVVALDQLSCHIPSGCIYGLVGANGAGKSTFLRLASGVYKPDGGSITIGDESVFDNPKAKEQFVLVPDELFFLPQSNMCRMAVLYAAAYKNFSYKRFYALTEQFGLNPQKTVFNLFQGYAPAGCVYIGAFLHDGLFVFDETFDGLDPVMRNLVKQTLYQDVVDRGVTAVVSSHSLRELEDTCDQLALLYKGGLVFESDVQSLKTSLFKVQLAFSDDYDKSRFQELDIVAFEKQGSVSSLIVRGEREKSLAALEAMQPILFEMLPLTLEEVFIYELEALGYVFDGSQAKGRSRS